jgi:hypothetical protein
MDEKIMIGVVMVTLFISAAYMIISIVNSIRRSKRDRYTAEVSAKVVEKLGTGPDMMAFVNSDAYKNLLGGEPVDHRGAYATRILNTLQGGMVLLFAGGGMFFVATFVGDRDGVAFLRVTGGILVAVGIGLAVSAGWSYALLKRWGLLLQDKASE